MMFHLLRAALVWLSFFTKQTAGEPETKCSQVAAITRPQVGSRVQNSSNLKGLGKKAEVVFVFKKMGQ
jgi:hypothetical protein